LVLPERYFHANSTVKSMTGTMISNISAVETTTRFAC
jgi:hypothetical protein